jgi:hypothetical protein
MQQMEFFAIPSPCIGVCESGPRGYCKGCFRSREERTHWLEINDQTKRIIVSACNRRKKAFEARKTKDEKTDTHFKQGDLF